MGGKQFLARVCILKFLSTSLNKDETLRYRGEDDPYEARSYDRDVDKSCELTTLP